MSYATRQLHPELQTYADYCLSWARALGIAVQVTSVLRESTKQAQLRLDFERCLATGKEVWPGNPDARCRYPANRPGDSAHEYGLAWDSVCSPDRLAEWVAIRRAVGWTVPENDLIHAELDQWRLYLA